MRHHLDAVGGTRAENFTGVPPEPHLVLSPQTPTCPADRTAYPRAKLAPAPPTRPCHPPAPPPTHPCHPPATPPTHPCHPPAAPPTHPCHPPAAPVQTRDITGFRRTNRANRTAAWSELMTRRNDHGGGGGGRAESRDHERWGGSGGGDQLLAGVITYWRRHRSRNVTGPRG